MALLAGWWWSQICEEVVLLVVALAGVAWLVVGRALGQFVVVAQADLELESCIQCFFDDHSTLNAVSEYIRINCLIW